ncbi:MAG TPA: hypothetical protein VGM22_06525 [Methylomirabilota bacterium]|jgi:hypothetical protein
MSRLVAVLMLALVPMTALAAPPSTPVLEHLTDLGGALSLGFGVTPLRPELAPPVPGPPELSLQSSALSFDLKLRWPGSDVLKSVEPYLVLGPALFVVEPDYVSRLLGTRVDPTLRLGTKAGAGVNWHLGKDVTLFGAYESTTGGASPFGKTSGDPAVTGYDFTYGIRVRY